MAFVGIDLGTTNSCACIVREGKTEMVKNSLNRVLTPSIVSIVDNGSTGNEIVIGDVAKNRLVTHPASTVARFKTFMGTNKTFNFNGQQWRAEQFSAAILKSIMKDVKKELDGEEIEGLVISVPAYFNNNQRKAVKMAGDLAEIGDFDLICEPTAAALAFGYEEKSEDVTFLVLDIGGGTFDITLIEVFNGIYEIKGSAGDNQLGGEDFTDVIVNDFLTNNSLNKDELSERDLGSIRGKCEALKRTLATNNNAEFEIELNDKKYQYSLSNSKYEQISNNLLKKIQAPIIRVLKDSKVDLEEIDNIVLVGGSSRLKIFNDLIQNYFPETNILTYQPDFSIARGASLKAYFSSKSSKLQEYVVTDVTAFSLGTVFNEKELGRSSFTPIVERNQPLPVTKMIHCEKIKLADAVTFKLYQGENIDPEKNYKLGEVKIGDLPYGEAVPLELRFTINLDGIILVEASAPSLKLKKSVILKNDSFDISEDLMKQYKNELNELKQPATEQIEYKLILSKLERIFEETTGSEREWAGQNIKAFTYSIENDTPIQIEKNKAIVESFLERFNFE